MFLFLTHGRVLNLMRGGHYLYIWLDTERNLYTSTFFSSLTVLTSIALDSADFRTLGGTSTHPPVSSPLTLLTSVHWGRPLHVFGLTSEVSLVGAPVSLTMGCHGPAADSLYPEGVCESTFLFGTFTYPMRIPLEPFLPRSSVQGGLV